MHIRTTWMLAAAATMAIACHKDNRDGKDAPRESATPPPDKALFGEITSRDDLDLQPYLAYARSIVTHAKVAVPEPQPPLPPQRAFVTIWNPGGQPVIATGIGDSLASSVAAAAKQLDAQILRADRLRVELDLVSEAQPAAIVATMRERAAQAGLWGYAVTRAGEGGKPAKFGFILPMEMLVNRVVDVNSLKDGTLQLAGRKVAMAVAGRARLDENLIDSSNVYKFTTTSVVESSPPGHAVKLYRSMPIHPTTVTADEFLAAVKSSADYLARTTGADGHFIYMYRPIEDEPTKDYGWIRHAGGTYALLEAYGEFKDPLYISKAEKALEALKGRLKTSPNGSYLSDNADEEQQKVGGSGLAMIGFVRHAQLTGSTVYLETMREMARLIVHQQYPDGHFRANADVMAEDEAAKNKKLKKEVTYFAGEAILGLIRLYELDPNPQWLAAARKGADYLIDVRDAHDTDDTRVHDHWQSYALLDLYRATKDTKYSDAAWRIARAIIKGEMMPGGAKVPPAPDYAGAFYDLGETTPTSTRLEAFAADLELSRFMGADDAWLRGPAMATAVFMKAQQLTPDSAYFVKNPEKALGGVRESLMSSDVRVDYPQHAMCGWLRYARYLRDPEYGKPSSKPAAKITGDAGK